MRRIVFALAALALAACGQSQQQTASTSEAGCARSATHEITWSDESAPDLITTTSQGPSCLQAVVLFVLRNAEGDALWTFAGTHYDMTAGGTPPEDAPAVTDAQMDEFLAGWANVSQQRSGELPEWRAGVATLTESVQGFSYDTPFDHETYEMLRARNLPMLCYAAAAEASQCLVMDPASRSPTMIVAFGP
jgi:hypothetical protein